jgi:hypothetical protein
VSSRTATLAAPTPTTAQEFSFGDLLWAARNGHAQFRNRDRFESHLGWPKRKSLWMEHGRIQPTAQDIVQLRAALPLLRVWLDQAKRLERSIRVDTFKL